jgi:hypothetical protein
VRHMHGTSATPSPGSSFSTFCILFLSARASSAKKLTVSPAAVTIAACADTPEMTV